ncbi:MAG: DUF2130 domain-containing protein [Pseudomonadales bacterium]|nr:DUF2130 domain-containing protein [Pseudomonadales bacterium]
MNTKIIVSPSDEVTCPHCEKAFALKDGLTHQLIERYENEYDAKLSDERKALEAQISKDLERKQKRAFEEQLAELKDQLADSKAAEEKSKNQIAVAKAQAAKQAREEALDEAVLLKAEIVAKDEKLASYRNAELELRKQKREIEEKQAEIELELEKKLDLERKQIEAKVSESFSLREAELKKKIADAQKSNEELTRKLEQGSQQLQGEVLELEIEQLLEQAYPLDQIEPVKKGARGADVIQSVHLRSGTLCGKIIWETKRAENWSSKWITKLKEDQQLVNGDIAVLVTTVLPAGVTESIQLYEGVWLVKPEHAKGLSEALRTVLIEAQRQKSISVGKEEQMEALFDYICSNQFAQRIRSVVEGYEEMRTDLEKEKSAMQRIWKKREAQLSRITTQVMSVCGEIQGLSRASLTHLEGLPELEMIAN